MRPPEELLEFADRNEWRAWLEANHAEAQEAWLVHHKKGSRARSLTYEEAVEEALCFGWIDGLLRSLDAQRYVLRYSPRNRRSIWSESNKKRAEKLILEGRMTPAGLEKIEEARASGEWEAATLREDADAMPPELERALRSRGNALAVYRAWPASRRKQYLWWITSAKRPETRNKRILAVVQAAQAESQPGSGQTPTLGEEAGFH